jgi:hypothetical protein
MQSVPNLVGGPPRDLRRPGDRGFHGIGRTIEGGGCLDPANGLVGGIREP